MSYIVWESDSYDTFPTKFKTLEEVCEYLSTRFEDKEYQIRYKNWLNGKTYSISFKNYTIEVTKGLINGKTS